MNRKYFIKTTAGIYFIPFVNLFPKTVVAEAKLQENYVVDIDLRTCDDYPALDVVDKATERVAEKLKINFSKLSKYNTGLTTSLKDLAISSGNVNNIYTNKLNKIDKVYGLQDQVQVALLERYLPFKWSLQFIPNTALLISFIKPNAKSITRKAADPDAQAFDILVDGDDIQIKYTDEADLDLLQIKLGARVKYFLYSKPCHIYFYCSPHVVTDKVCFKPYAAIEFVDTDGNKFDPFGSLPPKARFDSWQNLNDKIGRQLFKECSVDFKGVQNMKAIQAVFERKFTLDNAVILNDLRIIDVGNASNGKFSKVRSDELLPDIYQQIEIDNACVGILFNAEETTYLATKVLTKKLNDVLDFSVSGPPDGVEILSHSFSMDNARVIAPNTIEFSSTIKVGVKVYFEFDILGVKVKSDASADIEQLLVFQAQFINGEKVKLTIVERPDPKIENLHVNLPDLGTGAWDREGKRRIRLVLDGIFNNLNGSVFKPALPNNARMFFKYPQQYCLIINSV